VKVKRYTWGGQGLAVPCDKVSWMRFFAKGCGAIKSVKKRPYGHGFLKYVVYFANGCRAVVFVKMGLSSGCYATLLVVEQGDDDG